MTTSPTDPLGGQTQERILALAHERGLSPEALAALFQVAELRTYQGQEVILSDRARSDAVYLLIEGRVIVQWRGEDKRAPLRALLSPGDGFGEDSLVPRGSTGAIALGEATCLRMEPAALRTLIAEHPEIDALLAQMTAIQGRRGLVLRHLRRCPLFRHCAPADLAGLLRAARMVRGEPGQVLYKGEDRLPGMLVVMEGDVLLRASGKIRLGRRTHDAPDLAEGEGSVVGESAMVKDIPLLHDVVAGADGCAVLELPRRNFDRAFANSLAFRRAVLSSSLLGEGDRTRLMMRQAQAMGRDLRIFQAVVSDDLSLDLGLLTRWLAEAAAEDWGDRVAVLRPDPAAEQLEVVREDLGEGWITTVRVPTAMPGPPLQLLETLLRSDMALLDLGAVLRTGTMGPWMERIQRVVVIGTQGYDFTGSDQALALSADLPVYTAVVPTEPPDPGAQRTVPFGCPRLHRDVIAELGKGTPRSALSDAHRAQVHRWMRAVTGRRLGVALGGGGALSFAELAVLQRLHEEGIPIDMVAGVSGGSIVGAFYVGGQDRPLDPGMTAPEGLEELPGLARLTLVGDQMEKVSLMAAVTGWSVVSFLERNLGHPRLEDLLVPFYPVCVDGDFAVQTHLHVGPLAYGTRASGSFPGTFTPTTMDLQELRSRIPLPGRNRRDLPSPLDGERPFEHLLDGGLLNNIPDDTLFMEGAQLVLACNVVPAPGPREETGMPLAVKVQKLQRKKHGRIARFLTELSPVVRFDDLFRAIYMLLFQPADWRSRTADVKYQATTRGFSFTAWSQGDEIRQQTLTEGAEEVDRVLAEVKRARQSLRWKRDQNVDYQALTQQVLASLAASLS